MIINCWYYGNNFKNDVNFYGLEIHKNRNSKLLWSYLRGRYWNFVLDVINLDTYSLADGYKLFIESYIAKHKNKYKTYFEYDAALEKEYGTLPRDVYLDKYNKRVDLLNNDLTRIYSSQIFDFIDCIFLYNPDHKLTAAERYYAYTTVFGNEVIDLDYKVECVISSSSLHNDIDISKNLKSKIQDSENKCYNDRIQIFKEVCNILQSENNNSIFNYRYDFFSFSDVFKFFLTEMIKDNCIIKKCPNCGRYFIPYNRIDEKYCRRLSPQDSTKNCSDYMRYKNYLEKSQNDEATKLHKQIYNSKANRVKRCKNPQLKDDFQNFKLESAKWKSDVKTGKKTEDEYIQWLKMVKEKKV